MGCNGAGGTVTVTEVETSSQASIEAPQTPLLGAAIPQYADPVPTFSNKRVNGRRPVDVDMLEVQQKVLPQSVYATLSAPFNKGTFVWAYKVGNRPAHWPGYTIEAHRFTSTTVSYFNDLQHADGSPPFLARYLTVDQTIHWADPLDVTHVNGCLDGPPYALPCLIPGYGPVTTTVHLHGGEDQSFFDGQPDTWFTPKFALRGAGYTTNQYLYPNGQEATTLWFHDHGLGVTRLNIFSGLAAFYLVRDNRDTGLASNPIGLPAEDFEQELMIQDRQFDTNGQLLFPDGFPAGLNGPPTNPDVHPYWIPEFFGDVMTVNGKSWPFLEVEPRRYRFRFVNGANARFVQMQLMDHASGAPGPAIWQIGSDGGLLNAPVKVTDPSSTTQVLTLGIAERADVIVDFAGQAGKTFILTNVAPTPFPDGDPPDPATTGQIMQFRVNQPLSGRDRSFNPAAPRTSLRAQPIVDIKPADTGMPPDVRRQLVLVEAEGPTDDPLIVLLNNTHWHGRIDETSTPVPGSIDNGIGDFSTENPRVGSTELWEIINLTDDAHPIHIHLIQFQEVNRQGFDATSYRALWDASFPGGTFDGVTYPPGTYIPAFGPPLPYTVPNTAGAVGGNPDVTPFLQGGPLAVDPNEAGWKDTMRMMPRQVSRVAVRWAPQDTPVSGVAAGTNLFPFDPTQGPGYIWHCHILDHEDNEMMRPYLVRP